MSLQSNYYPVPIVAGTTAGTYAAGDDARIVGAAPIESPALTGTPTATTAAAGTNTTQIATTAFTLANRGDRYLTTSTTSHSLTTGSKTFTVQSGLSYTPTQDVTIVYDAARHMHAIVTSYSGTSLVVNVDTVEGSGGPFTAWTINVGGLLTAQGALLEVNNLSDVSNPATALTNIGGVPTSRSISAGTGLTGGGDLTANRTLTVSYGTTSGTACQGNDSRLSDSRTPSSTLAHKASHATGGSDALSASDIGAAAASHAHAASDITSGTLDVARLPVGTGSTQVAAGNHTHVVADVTGAAASGSITTSGLTQATARLIGRTSSGVGAPEEIQIGSGLSLSAGELSATGSGVTSVTGTAPIVSSGGTTPAISISAATTSAAGSMSSADKTKLDGIASGAEVNVNADWNASSGDAQILNKPTLGTAAAAATTDFAAASHTHSASAISDSTTAGRALLTAADAAAQRTSLGLAASATTDTTNASNISSGTLAPARMGSGTPSASNFLRGDGSWQTVAAGVSGSTSTDNAIVRADSTANTVQESALLLDDATTSTQANVAIRNNHSQTNSALVLTPKGTGSFIVGPKPDGTSTGGNSRGANSVDIQSSRSGASQVASGTRSIAIGTLNTASNTESVAIGYSATSSAIGTVSLGSQNNATANYAAALGGQSNQANGSDWSCVAGGLSNTASNNLSFVGGGTENTASGSHSFVAGGQNNLASATRSFACGERSVADRYGMFAHSAGRFAANGDAQRIRAVLRCTTSNATATELFLNGSSSRLTIPTNKIMAGIINIVGTKTDGATVAHYVRQFCVKNVSGTSSAVYTAQTIGTDNAAGTSITFNDPDTNGDALSISVTGIASENWRWVASVDAVEITRT